MAAFVDSDVLVGDVISDQFGVLPISMDSAPDALSLDAALASATAGEGRGDGPADALQIVTAAADPMATSQKRPDTLSATGSDQYFTFTYYYGNGDYYSGVGYAAAGTYSTGQTISSSSSNEVGYYGYYKINSITTSTLSASYAGYVYVTSYYDGDTGAGTASTLSTSWTSYGLGYEYGYAGSSYDYFSKYYEADTVSGIDEYEFTYYYGNGDIYTGYGYTASGTYYEGQTVWGSTNETGYTGYYTIDSVTSSSYSSSYQNYVYVTDYYDGDTDYGYAYYAYGSGYSGLGSETGYAYSSGYSTYEYISKYYEADLASSLQKYTFTYYYGNGDYYGGYGYAASGTYSSGQTVTGSTTETGYTGYYVIGTVTTSSVSSSYEDYVYVDSYNDGDTGYGSAYYVYAYTGYSGLGSESGYVYSSGYSKYDYFSDYYEADLGSTLQKYTYTYTYGNGDYYTGYGYANSGTYSAGQTVTGYSNETGYTGSYSIGSVSTTSDSATAGTVYISSYYDGDTGYGSAYYVYGYTGYSGLGSEYGYAYNTNYSGTDTYFSKYYEADLSSSLQKYTFTYYYGNGDYYSGYGYASSNTYSSGQTITGSTNESGYTGYYTIGSVETTTVSSSYKDYLYVTGYYDGDTSYGTAYYAYGYGYYGLGSEYGYAYNSSYSGSDGYFSNYYEADLGSSLQKYTFTYYYGNGDYYTGYGYATSGTYSSGQTVSGSTNETGYTGYYSIGTVTSVTSGSDYKNYVYVDAYYDQDTSYGKAYYAYGYGYSGLGSESGYAYNTGYSTYDYFSDYYESDLASSLQKYTFTYYFGNGDYYSGYGYALAGTYAKGTLSGTVSNDTGYSGYYTIDSVTSATSGNKDYVYVTNYYDSESKAKAYYVSSYGYSGLGSEYGYAYSSGYATYDYFDNEYEADLSSALEKFTFTYTYGNGDYYSGYGYASAGTYASGQTVSASSNETGSTGYYTIGTVSSVTSGTRGYVYVTGYYDGDTTSGGYGGYGTAYYASGSGYSGLGSEYGYAYGTSYGGYDTYFDDYYEADLRSSPNGSSSLEKYSFTYYFGNGDYYSGYGYTTAGTYSQGQKLIGYSNETGSSGYYTIDSVGAATYGTKDYLYVTAYYDGDQASGGYGGYGTAYYAYGYGYTGLGSEYGYAYGSGYNGYDRYFSSYYEADLRTSPYGNAGIEKYTFTYYFGNDDYYTGYGYAASGTYDAADIVQVSSNETGESGYYKIDSVESVTSGSQGYVYIDGYYDGDQSSGGYGGYGDAYYAYGYGYSGLGSEYGYAYNSSYGGYDRYFSSYYEADLRTTPYGDGTLQKYEFTYYFENGDTYKGYGYASASTYAKDQTVATSGNEAGESGYYKIDAVSTVTSGSLNTVYVTSYYDGDLSSGGYGGYGDAYYAYGYGYYGLGSEYGYAYNSDYSAYDSYFSQYYEADLRTTAYGSGSLQKYTFTYYFGNNDYYTGYGYAAAETYTAGTQVTGAANETGATGYYVIDSVTTVTSGSEGYVSLTDYYDGDKSGGGYGGWGKASYVWGMGTAGLGSEYGYAYSYSSKTYGGYDTYFSDYYEADLRTTAASDDTQLQKFVFTYYYGNGDYYTGYGYGDAGKYKSGAKITGARSMETGKTGYYTIDSISTVSTGTKGAIYISSYYDGDLSEGNYGGYGTAASVTASGTNGLGSETGYAYDSNGGGYETEFSSSIEADLRTTAYTATSVQKYGFTYYYGNGDYYSGYGFATSGTYTKGQTVTVGSNETGGSGYYSITSVSTEKTGTVGDVTVTSYYDGDKSNGGYGGYGKADYVVASGSSGLGSESGKAMDSGRYGYQTRFSNYYEADLRQTAYSSSLQKYSFKYYFGSDSTDDYYEGYGYAASNTYTKGQKITGISNSTGDSGYYEITDVATSTSGTLDSLTVTAYHDRDTTEGGYGGYGDAAYVSATGYKGLKSEYGYAYNSSKGGNQTYFANDTEADLRAAAYADASLQKYNFTYYYGNGDYYTGYGYADAGTYSASQKITAASVGLTGSGYYVIDSVESASTTAGTEGAVKLAKYYDGDLKEGTKGGYGTADATTGSGSDGLGSESGTATNSLSETFDFTATSEVDMRSKNYSSKDSTLPSWVTGLKDNQTRLDVEDYLSDSKLDYKEMLDILQDAKDDSKVSSDELADLKKIVTNWQSAGLDSYLYSITNKLVNGDTANKYWTGGNLSKTSLGNLAANSSSSTLDSLIKKWYLGEDLPTPYAGGDAAAGYSGGSSYSYAKASGSLFVGGVSKDDINQGYAGTCYFVAAIASIADTAPSKITAMFSDNGNSTYGVRFYRDGKEDWVTVNTYLPVQSSGKLAFSGNATKSTSGELWVALVEKAYAQLNESGLGRSTSTNSYQAIEGGGYNTFADPFKQVANTASPTYYVSYNTSTLATWEKYEDTAIAAIKAGKLLSLGSLSEYTKNGKYELVSGHAFSITGYDSGTDKFEIRNPWGAHPEATTTFNMTWRDLYSYDVIVAIA